jgi:hypothetical protein
MTETLDIERFGVFQVFTGGGTGSGFLIKDNLLVTNCHVVAGFRTVGVERRDKRRILGTVRRLNPKRDLAIVELASPLDGEILALAARGELSANQLLHIVGFPVGLPLSVTEGVVSNPKQLFDGQEYVQTDAAVNPGNSGGPMLDEHKNIVAVTTCKHAQAELVAFGICHGLRGPEARVRRPLPVVRNPPRGRGALLRLVRDRPRGPRARELLRGERGAPGRRVRRGSARQGRTGPGAGAARGAQLVVPQRQRADQDLVLLLGAPVLLIAPRGDGQAEAR